VAGTVDIALVSLGTTPGLRRADQVLAEQIRAAGASCQTVPVQIGRAAALRRNPAVTDLVEALAARRAAESVEARAVIFSTVTAALLQRTPAVPWAVRFDSTAALNRPGWSGAWQRRRERDVLGRATLLLPWGERAAAAAGGGLVLRVPVDEIAPAATRDIDAIAYAGYPRKRGLDLLCAAWGDVARPGERLVIGGVERRRGLEWLERCGVREPAGVEWTGPLPRDEWLARVRQTRVFVNASRREDHGLAQLEALAAGCMLATVPSPGPYEALPFARQLAPELVADEVGASALARALRAGLDLDAPSYAARARNCLQPFRPEAVERLVAEQLLPGLGLR
jgi:glycosyltransferase involved in cell wall biosynthesis